MGLSVAKSGGGKGFGGPDGFITRRNAQLITQGEGLTMPFVYEPAEVFDIDLTNVKANLIGRVKFRLYREAGRAIDSLDWAYPLISNIRVYPVIHETVLIFDVYGKYYYINSINASNYINNNSLTGVTFAAKPDQQKEDAQQYQSVQSTGIPISDTEEKEGEELGDYFENENKNVPILLPWEGDTIIQGRFGNSIRLSSSEKSSLPSMKLTLIPGRQDTYVSIFENLDEHNCIWMTSDDALTFIPMGIPINSKNEPPSEYTGDQVIISTGRIIFNSKKNEILMFSNKGINLACISNFSVDSDSSVIINSKNNFELKTQASVITTSNNDTIINAPNIYLGEKDSSERVVKGDTLKSLIEQLIDILLMHKHPTGSGPSGPIMPGEDSQIRQIRGKLETALS